MTSCAASCEIAIGDPKPLPMSPRGGFDSAGACAVHCPEKSAGACACAVGTAWTNNTASALTANLSMVYGLLPNPVPGTKSEVGARHQLRRQSRCQAPTATPKSV